MVYLTVWIHLLTLSLCIYYGLGEDNNTFYWPLERFVSQNTLENRGDVSVGPIAPMFSEEKSIDA